MELLRNAMPVVTFVWPTNNTNVSSAHMVKDGVRTPLPKANNGTLHISTATIPFQQFDGSLQVEWKFTIPGATGGTFTHTEYYEVVTPLLSLAELTMLLPNETDAERLAVEKVVRFIIEAHTGQNFGKTVGKIVVSGSDHTHFRLPRRLISFSTIETVQSTYNITAYDLSTDGWSLTQNSNSLLTIKHMPTEFALDLGPVVTTPYTSYFKDHKRPFKFTITGIWGYNFVPEPVKEAAKLLVDDYSCGEASYRDKYLESITAADWRLQFSSRSWENTGNVRADQLLANYVLQRGWLVI